jgi:hypothetical protein
MDHYLAARWITDRVPLKEREQLGLLSGGHIPATGVAESLRGQLDELRYARVSSRSCEP